MRVADNGFFPWLIWVLCKWNGTINRLSYLGGLACLLALTTAYSFLVGQFYMRLILPPPDGAAANIEYMLHVLRSGAVSQFVMLPLTFLSIMLDAKRLRSMGAFPWIAVIINVLSFAFRFVEAAGETGAADSVGGIAGGIANIVSLAYLLILLLLPPRDTARPLNRSFPGRPGSGPRRMSGKELTNWRLIAPAPRRETDEAASKREQDDGQEQ